MNDMNEIVLTREAIAKKVLPKDQKPLTILAPTVRKRRTLFKKSKPFIRPFALDDLWVFWAAYKEGTFKLPIDLDKNMFYKWLMNTLSRYSSVLVVEDSNKAFKDKRGIVCFIVINTDGWKIEPQVEFFKWATKQNILRVNVRYFNWVRQNKEIGVCMVRCLSNAKNLFHHVKKYGVLNFVGKIPGGDHRGDEYIFSIRGKKKGEEICIQT